MAAQLHDLAAERRVLANLLHVADPADLGSSDRLDPAECYHPDHSAVLRAIYAVHAAGQTIDAFTVRAALDASQSGRSAAEALQALDTASVRLSQTRSAVGRVRELARLRRARESLLGAVAATERGDMEAANGHALAAGEIARSTGAVGVLTAHDCVLAALSQLANVDGRTRQRTGFPLLDAALHNFRPATMVIVGGSTGSGKSSLALAIALFLAKTGFRPGIVSCEDADTIWGERILAHEAQINPETFQTLDFRQGFVGDAEAGLERAKALGMRFAFALNRPVVEVVKACRSLVSDHGCDIVFVDYVQAIKVSGSDRKVGVRDAAQDVKAEAQALNVPLVLMSQLSRPPKDKPFREPHASDLKESGDLENMAEAIVLLWKSGDDDHAETHGKVVKVKWGASRPRFKIERSPAGAITALVPRLAESPLDSVDAPWEAFTCR